MLTEAQNANPAEATTTKEVATANTEAANNGTNLPTSAPGSEYLGINPADLQLSADDVQVQEIELAGQYWTPEEKGENKIVAFLGIHDRTTVDEDTGEAKKLPTVKFAALVNGAVTQLYNASTRLVGIFEDPMYKPGQKFLVTYVGKKASTKSGYKYDDWSVKPVVSRAK